MNLFSHQPRSLLFSLTFSEIRLAIFEYLAMPQYAPVMSIWQFSSTLVVENHKYLTSTHNLPDASSNLSCIVQKAKFLVDDNALLNKQMQRQITDKFLGLRYVKFDQDAFLLLQISYVIYFANATNKINIVHRSLIKYKRVTRGILSTELYVMAYKLNIKKRH